MKVQKNHLFLRAKNPEPSMLIINLIRDLVNRNGVELVFLLKNNLLKIMNFKTMRERELFRGPHFIISGTVLRVPD